MRSKTYDKKGTLIKSVSFDSDMNIKSMHHVENKGYLQYNVWSYETLILYRTYKEDVKLVEDQASSGKVFRCAIKGSDKLEIPQSIETHFEMSDKDILNFNVDKIKLNLWKTKTQKKTKKEKII